MGKRSADGDDGTKRSASPNVKTWLRDNGYAYLAAEIDGIEAEWRGDGKATRRNWWDVLAGDSRGRPRQVSGRTFPILPEAVERREALKATGTAAAPKVVSSAADGLDEDASRLLDGAVRALDLAVSSLGSSSHTPAVEHDGEWAIELGLAGIAAELALGSILVQARGRVALLEPSGRYKTFGKVHEEVHEALKSEAPDFEFLWAGVAEHSSDARRIVLLDLLARFKLLGPLRAAGVHAAQGLTHEATLDTTSRVSDLLDLMAQVPVFEDRLTSVPRSLVYTRDRALLVDDLARRLAMRPSDDAQALASLFLVLPDVPSEMPEWLAAFERITVAPREQDIVYLMEVLRSASPVVLQRVRGGGGELARVLVNPDDPRAMPIAPHYLKSEFKTLRDQFFAERGLANTRLGEGVLDLPNAAIIRVMFARGLDECGVLAPDRNFTAHDAWPSVASGLMVQGTPGPYWFLVRRTDDHGQLAAKLREARELATPGVLDAVDECLQGLDVLRSGKPLSGSAPLARAMLDARTAAEQRFAELRGRRERNEGTERAWPASLASQFDNVIDSGLGIGDLIDGVLAADIPDPGRRYWTRILAEATHRRQDAEALVRLLDSSEVSQAHTAARKALRLADFLAYGPHLPT